MKRSASILVVGLALLLLAGPAGAQDGFQSRYFESDGVRLHYVDEGSGEPVLLIHGFSIDLAFNWVDPGIVSALIDAGYRVIAYDARGHGRSDKPHDPAEYGPVEVEDAVRLLDHVGVSRAHVVGYSRGGLLANRLGDLHPERVLTVVLGGYGAGPGEPVVALSPSEVVDSLAKGSIGPILRGLQGEGHPGIPPEEIAGLSRMVASMNDLEALVAAFRGDASFPPVTEDGLRGTTSPTLALVGELDAMRAEVDRMAEVMSGLEVLVIPGADHVTALSRPEFVTGLLGFLSKHPEEGPAGAGGKAPEHEHPAGSDHGRVGFPTECSPEVRPEFERAVAILHSFGYEEARRTFRAVADRDPACGMAWWGVAMTHFHQHWDQPTPAELEAGRTAAERAARVGAGSERERAYIAAIGAFYRDADRLDHPTRALAYREAMARLVAGFPEDREAAIFHALSILATRSSADPDYADQRRAGEILTRLLSENSEHPGIVHYIIHAFDYPELAELALPAARIYAGLAPASPHALHMPSHIFTRLGLWEESIASNLEVARVAREQLARTDPGAVAFNFAVGYAVVSAPARYALERRDWRAAADLEPPKWISRGRISPTPWRTCTTPGRWERPG